MTPHIFSRIFWKQYFLLEKDFVETDELVTIKFYKKKLFPFQNGGGISAMNRLYQLLKIKRAILNNKKLYK